MGHLLVRSSRRATRVVGRALGATGTLGDELLVNLVEQIHDIGESDAAEMGFREHPAHGVAQTLTLFFGIDGLARGVDEGTAAALGADTLVHGHFGEDKTMLTLRLTDVQHFEKNTVLPLVVPPKKLHLFDKESGNRIGN